MKGDLPFIMLHIGLDLSGHRLDVRVLEPAGAKVSGSTRVWMPIPSTFGTVSVSWRNRSTAATWPIGMT